MPKPPALAATPGPTRPSASNHAAGADAGDSPFTVTRILLVEDEESFSDPLAYLLRKEGYQVTIAGSGHGALAEFNRNGADLVLLDLMLPGLPGKDVCRLLREQSDVPIIMLTALGTENDKVEGFELGADD